MAKGIRYVSEIEPGVWQYRRTIPAKPEELRKRIGRGYFTKTWRERDTDIALIFSEARQLGKQHTDLIERDFRIHVLSEMYSFNLSDSAHDFEYIGYSNDDD